MVAVNNGLRCVKLTRPSISRFGLLMHDESFKFLDENHPTSFSTELSFSIFPINGDGNVDGLVLDFVLNGYWSKWLTTGGSFALSEENRFLSVGFDAKMDGNVGAVDDRSPSPTPRTSVSVSRKPIGESQLALSQGPRVGDDAGQVLLPNTRKHQEAVADGELDLADDVEAMPEEEVVVPVDRAAE
ncbi:hypothetical protein FH972_001381 [Carpinus fangiana]|uniref:Legume lectin domain-containing protein n=1 Tax=Carpinus fangiana TaxID=176857 RepID=A0A5N6QES5_9ROSI|nr:hypothetical protein FH972_001381 [Carpinus fangiana]